ncbi:hypothetical protein DERP_006009 [Dermatophagoides pteronyssinus]|uniref:Uncharacterized protein n=1 Tax=Dermatophagoides pteronyssinus TaxID=6956 RepID=A0ABQ8JS20_DERPT|nr:hypothetical protein DERP_006009 [Dermatophagoides pteronyssinus]
MYSAKFASSCSNCLQRSTIKRDAGLRLTIFFIILPLLLLLLQLLLSKPKQNFKKKRKAANCTSLIL